MNVTSFTRLFSGLTAFCVAALGLFVLAAWRFGFSESTRLDPDLVPMAPNSAILFLVLGLAQAARARWPESPVTRKFGVIGSIAAIVAAMVVLVDPWPSVAPPWSSWIPVDNGFDGSVPVGQMSPLTATAFILTSLTMFVESTRLVGRSWARWLSRIAAGASLAIGLITIVGFLSGTPVFYGTDIIPVALLTGVAITALNAGVLLLGLRDHVQHLWSPRPTDSPVSEVNRNYRRLTVLAATLASVLIGLFWFFSVRHRGTAARESVHSQLDAIANLKKEAVMAWRNDRLREARLLQRVPTVGRDLSALIANPGDAATRARVASWLDPIQSTLQYESATVVDPQGNPVFSLPDSSRSATPRVSAESMLQAQFTQNVVFTDTQRTVTADPNHLELLVPIVSAPTSSSAPKLPAAGKPIALIVLRLDLRLDLFPSIQSWPLPVTTGETTLLWHMADEELVVLNHPSRPPGATPSEHQPSAALLQAAVMNTSGDVGVREEVDGRNVTILSTLRSIPNSRWIVFTKIDATEAYAPIWRDAWQTNASVALLLLTVVLMGVLLVRNRDALLLRQTLIADRAGKAATERLALVTRYANDIILIMDEAGRILEANDRALSAYGYTLDELQALPPGGLRSATTRGNLAQQLELFDSPGGGIFETVHCRKDGSVFPVEVNGRVVRIGEQPHVLGIFRDITERKWLSQQIASQEARFRFIFEHAPVGISLASADGCELANEEHARITGVSAVDSIEPGAFERASHPEDYARQMELAQAFLHGEADSYTVEKRYLHSNGAVIWAQLTSRRFHDSSVGRAMTVTTLVDISERRDHEDLMEALNRRYLAITQINQALVQRVTPEELFKEVCRVLVETGGFKTAWIGWTNPATGQVDPVAIAGDEYSYVRGIRLSTDPLVPEGQGPGGIALRENHVYVCNDFFNDPVTLPWRAAARPSGIRSLVALPLGRDGGAEGLLLVYAQSVDAFGTQELRLLEEVVRDVSFGLTVFASDDRRRETEAALRTSESRLQFLLSATPAIIYSLRATGDFGTSFISRNVRDALGYEPACFTDEPGFWQSHLHPEDVQSANSAFTFTSATSAIIREYRFRHRDGSYRWMHDEMRLIRDGQGMPREFVGYWSDITERREAEDKVRKLSYVVEKSPLSIVITDKSGGIEYANPKACAVTGYTLDELIGRNPRMLKSGETPREVYQEMWETITRGEVWSGELRNRRKNGETFLEAAVIAPVTDGAGQTTHYVAMKDDVTAQRRQVSEAAAKLAQEREVSEMKTRFISVTSHEFRTPMAAAMGSIEILSNHLDRLTPAKRLELFGRITTALRRMTDMLDDILILNRMDAKRTEVQPTVVNLREFAQNLIEEIRIGDHGVHQFDLHPSGPSGNFVSDTTLLHHVLSNLLNNAVRYSPAGTLVTLRLNVEADQAEFTVEDHGIGIPPADHARIFEPFERGSNVGTLKGTGLGLSIVKRMILLLGGTITVNSTVGGGSQFTVTLPRLQPAAVPA